MTGGVPSPADLPKKRVPEQHQRCAWCAHMRPLSSFAMKPPKKKGGKATRDGVCAKCRFEHERSCKSKRSYGSFAVAARVALNASKRAGMGLRPYKCTYADHWHLTHKTSRKL